MSCIRISFGFFTSGIQDLGVFESFLCDFTVLADFLFVSTGEAYAILCMALKVHYLVRMRLRQVEMAETVMNTCILGAR